MKKLMIASAIALMCFSANAFAEDDGYGNDIPAARSEGTVDDGYGNKLPASNEPEYKSFEEARSSSKGGDVNQKPLSLAGHFGIGLGSYWDYPSEYLGDNDWLGISMDFGIAFKYRITPMLSFVPELNLGFVITSREVASGSSWWYGDYRVDETRVLFDINIPVTVRFTPLPMFYVEAGGRVSFNLATSHTLDYYDEDGNSIDVPSRYSDLDEWKVKTFVPSVIGGFGFTINKQLEIGARFIMDLGGIEDDDKIFLYDTKKDDFVRDANGDPRVETNGTKNWTIQVVGNYYFM